MRKNRVTLERLNELFDLNVETGELRWRVSKGPNAQAGRVAGAISRQREQTYRVVQIDGLNYPVHMIVWAIMHTEWPDRDIDHIDQNGLHNWPSNLRLATRSENGANQRVKGRVSRKGVYWDTRRQKWVAQIHPNGRHIFLGRFTDERTAALHYDAAHKLLWPEITNAGALNFPLEESDQIILRKAP